MGDHAGVYTRVARCIAMGAGEVSIACRRRDASGQKKEVEKVMCPILPAGVGTHSRE